MITLYDGCYCSNPAVSPKNWKKAGASTISDWVIQYRFYDPTIKDAQGKIKPKQIIIKGMNKFKVLSERRSACQGILDQEIKLLCEDGYNPITGQYMAPEVDDIEYEIDPSTPFIQAFTMAVDRLQVVPLVKNEMTNIIARLKVAAAQLRLDTKEISKITRRDIKYLLDQCIRNHPTITNNRYNTYRGYLMMIFKELVELEAAPVNVIRDISKRGVTKRIKEVLTDEQREKIDQHLVQAFPRFRNFVHLFFHSGGRKTELLQLKPGMVNLANQTYRSVIKKRKSYTEVDRSIKTIALPFWEFFLKDCPADQYIFGTLFKPGPKPMGTEMPTNYWKKFVKKQLSIDVDFYALKHLNVSEVVDELDEKDTARQLGHTDAAMVVSIYDVKQKDRQHERLIKVANKFAG